MARNSGGFDPKLVKRVLVVKLRHHGDVLLTTPVFSTLKKNIKGVQIDALVYADTRQMLEEHPAVSKVFSIDRAWKSLPILTRTDAELRLLLELRGRAYDLLVHLTDHPRGAWLARLLGSSYSVAPSYGHRSAFWRHSFTHLFSLPKNARRHMVEWHLDSLRRIGIWPNADEKSLVLVPGIEGEAEATQCIEAHGIKRGGFVHLHPASRWSFKCWTEEKNAELADRLAMNGQQVVLTAAPDERELQCLERILARSKTKPINLGGKLSLKGLAALTAQAKLFIGVDSAPMHIASAMGTPVIAIFGPSGELEWGPWSPVAKVIASTEHACRPCGIDGCGGGKISECLLNLPLERVLHAAMECLGKPDL